MEEQAKTSEQGEAKDTTASENKEEESESKKRARDENEEELPASKRPKLDDDSASSSSDEISTHSSDADIDAEEENLNDAHEDGANGKVEANEQTEEHTSTMVPANEEDASDDIEAASVLEEDAPSIHSEKEEFVKDVEGNVLPTNKSDDAAASESAAPAKVTADQEQALAETELKFLEHSLNDTALLSVLSMLKSVHASYYASDNYDTGRDVKVIN